MGASPQSRGRGGGVQGLITIEEACRRYHMSEEEFIAWRCAFENFGISGLNAGRIQQQRGRGLTRAGDPSPGQVHPSLKRQ